MNNPDTTSLINTLANLLYSFSPTPLGVILSKAFPDCGLADVSDADMAAKLSAVGTELASSSENKV